MAKTKVFAGSVSAEVLKGIFSGVRIRTSFATPNSQVVISEGARVGAVDGADVIVTSGDLTLNIATTGVNGLDTGSEAADTWYYIWLIKQPGGSVAGLLSASPTSPTLPTGYTIKRLVGAVRNDGSSNFIHFYQEGALVLYKTNVNVYHASAGTTWIAHSVEDAVPHLVARVGIFTGSLEDTPLNFDAILALGHAELAGGAVGITGSLVCRTRAPFPAPVGTAGGSDIRQIVSSGGAVAFGANYSCTPTFWVHGFELTL